MAEFKTPREANAAGTVELNVKVVAKGSGTPIANARVVFQRFDPANPVVESPRFTAGNGLCNFYAGPPLKQDYRYFLLVDAEGQKPYATVPDAAGNMPAFGTKSAEYLVELEPSAAGFKFAPETGLVSVDGLRFVNGGKTWAGRGTSGFLHFARWRAGKDVSRDRQWFRQHGIGVVRNFPGGVSWKNDYVEGVEQLNFFDPWNDPSTPAQWASYVDWMAEGGLRVEASIGTGDYLPLAYWQRVAQQINEIGGDLVFGEATNEPWAHGPNPEQVMQGIARKIPWAYGIQPTATPGQEAYDKCPVLDFGTTHLPRDRQYTHNPRDCRRMSEANPVPWADDEPIGFIDEGYPNYVPRGLPDEWGFVNGGGMRTTDVHRIVGHVAVARVMAPWTTIHPQYGLEGRIPTGPHDEHQAMIATEVAKVFSFIPDEAYTGRYTRAGFTDFPFDFFEGDSETDHAYGAVQPDGSVYAVIPLPTEQWLARGFVCINGFRLVKQGPQPYIGYFAR